MKCVVEEKVILIGDIEPFQNHKERLLHFYTKLGFEIKLYDVMIDYNFGELRILI